VWIVKLENLLRLRHLRSAFRVELEHSLRVTQAFARVAHLVLFLSLDRLDVLNAPVASSLPPTFLNVYHALLGLHRGLQRQHARFATLGNLPLTQAHCHAKIVLRVASPPHMA
jgi:hypothetical protein